MTACDWSVDAVTSSHADRTVVSSGSVVTAGSAGKQTRAHTPSNKNNTNDYKSFADFEPGTTCLCRPAYLTDNCLSVLYVRGQRATFNVNAGRSQNHGLYSHQRLNRIDCTGATPAEKLDRTSRGVDVIPFLSSSVLSPSPVIVPPIFTNSLPCTFLSFSP